MLLFCRFLENISNDAGVDDDNDVDAGTNDDGVVKTESDYVGTMSFGYNVVAAEKSGDVEWMLSMNFLYSDLHKSPPFLLQVLYDYVNTQIHKKMCYNRKI